MVGQCPMGILGAFGCRKLLCRQGTAFVAEMKQHLEMMEHFSEMIFGRALERLVVKRHFELEFQYYLDLKRAETPVPGVDPEMQQWLDLRRCAEMPTGLESELDSETQHSCLLGSHGPEMTLDLRTELLTEI